jgi:hypothetical protein
MNLYLISRPDNLKPNWDNYVSAVVVAENEGQARAMFPDDRYSSVEWRYDDGDEEWGWYFPVTDHYEWVSNQSWINPADVVVKFLGVAVSGLHGVVTTDFLRG